MSSCSVFVFLSLMEFAVVNNFMGPIATKAMKGYSDENLQDSGDDKVSMLCTNRKLVFSSKILIIFFFFFN